MECMREQILLYTHVFTIKLILVKFSGYIYEKYESYLCIYPYKNIDNDLFRRYSNLLGKQSLYYLHSS